MVVLTIMIRKPPRNMTAITNIELMRALMAIAMASAHISVMGALTHILNII